MSASEVQPFVPQAVASANEPQTETWVITGVLKKGLSDMSTLNKILFIAATVLGAAVVGVLYAPVCIFVAYRCLPVLAPCFTSHLAAEFVSGCIGAVAAAPIGILGGLGLLHLMKQLAARFLEKA
jgi:hypothetical protein